MEGYKIYAVDFDKTLSMAKWPDVGDPNLELISYLKSKQAAGDKVILNSCRVGEALEKAISFCASYGLVFDAINENLPEVVEKFGNDSRKISADYYIDDKAVSPDEITGEEKIIINSNDLPITIASKLIGGTRKIKNKLTLALNKAAGGDGTEDLLSREDIKELSDYLLTWLMNNPND